MVELRWTDRENPSSMNYSRPWLIPNYTYSNFFFPILVFCHLFFQKQTRLFFYSFFFVFSFMFLWCFFFFFWGEVRGFETVNAFEEAKVRQMAHREVRENRIKQKSKKILDEEFLHERWRQSNFWVTKDCAWLSQWPLTKLNFKKMYIFVEFKYRLMPVILKNRCFFRERSNEEIKKERQKSSDSKT